MLALLPKFAFLDEIDSGVDVDALKLVVAGIERMKANGAGFVLVTHYDALLSHIAPDHVHVMRDGKIVASGGRELSERIKKEGFANI
jgi:Fe-S cluster assembly ATP-binding protein